MTTEYKPGRKFIVKTRPSEICTLTYVSGNLVHYKIDGESGAPVYRLFTVQALTNPAITQWVDDDKG